MAAEEEEPGGGGTTGPDYYHRVSSVNSTCDTEGKGFIKISGVTAFNGAVVSAILRNNANTIVGSYVFPANVTSGTYSFNNNGNGLSNGDYNLTTYDQNNTNRTWNITVDCFRVKVNTGFKGWKELEQYDTLSGQTTGQTKLNVPGDPDYIAPVSDPAMCPIGGQ